MKHYRENLSLEQIWVFAVREQRERAPRVLDGKTDDGAGRLFWWAVVAALGTFNLLLVCL